MQLSKDQQFMFNVEARLEFKENIGKIAFKARRDIAQSELIQFMPLPINDQKIKFLNNPNSKPNSQFVFDPNMKMMLKAIEPIKQGDHIIFVVNSFLVHSVAFQVQNNQKLLMLKPLIPEHIGMKKEDFPTLEQLEKLYGNPEPNMQMFPLVRNQGHFSWIESQRKK